MCVCVYVYVLRIVSRDKILCFRNTFILIMLRHRSVSRMLRKTQYMNRVGSVASLTCHFYYTVFSN